MVRNVLGVTAILLALTGCSPAPEPSSNVTRSPGQLRPVQEVKPDIVAAKIGSDIVGRAVHVAELTGAGPETDWTFEAGEFRQVDILEKRVTDKGLTLVVFIVTRNNPRQDEDPVQVSGKLQLEYELKAGLWVLTTIENLTFRYSIGQAT